MRMADGGKADLPPGGFGRARASAVWAAVGDAFFRELVKHLSAVLSADLLYVGEYVSKPVERIVTIAAGSHGAEARGFDYLIENTPAAEVFKRGRSIYEAGIRGVFPSDAALKEAGAEAFAGKALFDSHGQCIGAIIALWRHALSNTSGPMAVLEAFAPRTAAELERRQDENRHIESEQRYRAFIASSQDAMWRIEFEEPIPVDLPEDEQIERVLRLGYIAECNDAAVWMYLGRRVPPSEAIGKRVAAIVSRTDMSTDDFRAMIRAGYKAERVAVRLLAGDTPRYVVRSAVGVVEDGKLLRVWGTARDIGDLRKAEQEWHAWEQRFRMLLETIDMAAVMLDPQGNVLFCNDYLLRMTGWTREDLVGKNWFNAMVPDEHRDRLRNSFLQYLADGGEHERFEGVVLTRSGARRVIEWDRTLLRDGENRIVAAASIGRDITNQRALEARLREADRLESIRKLAGAIAHDFNNLLVAIVGFGEELLEAHRGGPERHAAEQIIRAGEQGSALARQLVAFSRNVPVASRPVDVNDVIRDSRGIVEHLLGKRVALVLNLAESLPKVMADPGQMNQILVNLALNAHDAMPDGGQLTITSRTVEVREDRPAEAPDVEPGSYVEIDVADTGTGIPDEVRTRVFEPFFTTKPGRGTGLGLASVYGIVRQSGGYVYLDSEVGKGTTFHILLPALP